MKREAFRSRKPWSTASVNPRNDPEPADVSLLEPVPTPDPVKPGIVVVQPGELSLLRRYLLEYRAEPKMAVALLIDDQSRIRKLCVHSRDGSGAALPFAGKYYGSLGGTTSSSARRSTGRECRTALFLI